MKYINLTLLLIIHLVVNANEPTLYGNLQRINACWNNQKDIQKLPIYTSSYSVYSETNLIQLHLKLVEQVLRNRSTAGLSEAQKAARLLHLKHLHEYWNTNVYPVNNKVAYRNPVFIDDYNTFCAVGYLIKTSGHEPLARNIQATQNLSYLKNIKADGLNDWITASGLTIEELAWIQPGYTAINHSRSLGNGVNGPVNALAGNDDTHTLYVGGKFTQADGTVSCNNIVAVNYSPSSIFDNTFTPLGDGLNGEINVLYKDGQYLYAGGHFDHSGSKEVHNIAMWDGQQWEGIGTTLNGTVYSILKYNNMLFAGGQFTFTHGSQTYQNLACWSGTEWLPICYYMNGAVYALAEFNHKLVIGGAFTEVDTSDYNYIVTYDGGMFEGLKDGVTAMVKTFEVLGSSTTHPMLIAAGEAKKNGNTSLSDSTIFAIASYTENWGWDFNFRSQVLQSGQWSAGRILMVNTISNGYVGGKMSAGGMYSSSNTGKYDAANGSLASFASTQGEVSAMLNLGKRVFMGGDFSMIYDGTPGGRTLSNFASNLIVWDPDYVGLREENGLSGFAIAPNPTISTTEIQSASNINLVKAFDLSGKLIFEKKLSSPAKQYTIERNLFPNAGLYILSIGDENGNQSNQKLVVN